MHYYCADITARFNRIRKGFNMSASSSEINHGIISVFGKAFEDPSQAPNILLVESLPEQPIREACYIIEATGVPLRCVYVMDAGIQETLNINDNTAFLHSVKALLDNHSSKRLDLNKLVTFVQQHCDYTIPISEHLAREFAIRLYHPKTYIEFDEARTEAYMQQIKQLVRFMQTELVPVYVSAKAQRESINEIYAFISKLTHSIEKGEQPPVFYNTLKSALEFNCFIYSQKDETRYGASFRHLCQQLGHCGPGSMTSVILKMPELKGLANRNQSIINWLTAFRKSIFGMLIEQHASNNNISNGLNVHLNPWFYRIGNQLGLNVGAFEAQALSALNDVFSDDANLAITQDTPEWIQSQFETRFHRSAIIENITTEFLAGLPAYNFSQHENYLTLTEAIESGLLEPLFKLANKPMTILHILMPGTDQRRMDFPRNLRRYVEQLLIDEGFIRDKRTIGMDIRLSDAGLILELISQDATDLEMSELDQSLINKLSKLSGVTAHSSDYIIQVSLTDFNLFFTILLALGDLLEEFDINQPMLMNTLNQIIALNQNLIDNSQKEFLLQRLDTTARHNDNIKSIVFGINPCYIIDSEDEAIALLQWDGNYDYRNPEYIHHARHVSGLPVVDWALQENKTRFLIQLLFTKSFDPNFDPDFDAGFEFSENTKSALFNHIKKDIVNIATTLIKNNDFKALRELLNRLPGIEQLPLNLILKAIIDHGYYADEYSQTRLSVMTELCNKGASLRSARIDLTQYLQFILKNSQSEESALQPEHMNLEAANEEELTCFFAFLHDNFQHKTIKLILCQPHIQALRVEFYKQRMIAALRDNQVSEASYVLLSFYNVITFTTQPPDAVSQIIQSIKAAWHQQNSDRYSTWFASIALELVPIAYQRRDFILLRYLLVECEALQTSAQAQSPDNECHEALILLHRSLVLITERVDQSNPPQPLASSFDAEDDYPLILSGVHEQVERDIQISSFPYINWEGITKCQNDAAYASAQLTTTLLYILRSHPELAVSIHQTISVLQMIEQNKSRSQFTPLIPHLLILLTHYSLKNEPGLRAPIENYLKIILDVLLNTDFLRDSLSRTSSAVELTNHVYSSSDHPICSSSSNPPKAADTAFLSSSAESHLLSIQQRIVERIYSLASAFLQHKIPVSRGLQRTLEAITGKQLFVLIQQEDQYSHLFQNMLDAVHRTMIMEEPLSLDKQKFLSELIETLHNTATLAHRYLSPCSKLKSYSSALNDKLLKYKEFLVSDNRDPEMQAEIIRLERIEISRTAKQDELNSYFALKTRLEQLETTAIECHAMPAHTTVSGNLVITRFLSQLQRKTQDLTSRLILLEKNNDDLKKLYHDIDILIQQWHAAASEDEKINIERKFHCDYPYLSETVWNALFTSDQDESTQDFKAQFSIQNLQNKLDAITPNILKSMSLQTSRLFAPRHEVIQNYVKYRLIKEILLFGYQHQRALSQIMPEFKVKFGRKNKQTFYIEPATIQITPLDIGSQPLQELATAFINLKIPHQCVNSMIIISNMSTTSWQQLALKWNKIVDNAPGFIPTHHASTSQPASLIQSPLINASVLSCKVSDILSARTMPPPLPLDKAGTKPIMQHRLFLDGPSSSGKSALLHRAALNTYSGNLSSTIGVDYQNRDCQLLNRCIRQIIWESGGNYRFESMRAPYIRKANVIILCADSTNYHKLHEIESRIKYLRTTYGKEIKLIIAFNKCDQQEISDTAMHQVCEQNGVVGIKTSAYDGTGVEDTFILAEAMIMADLVPDYHPISSPDAQPEESKTMGRL